MRFGYINTVVSLMTLIFSAGHAFSQVPGYMGKRVSVGYGFYFNPALGNIVMDYSDKPFNTLHEFFLEGATARRFVIGISARLYKYTYNNVEQVDVRGGRSSSSVQQIDDSPEGTYEIRGRSYQLYGKLFKSRYVAPWGKYFSFGIVMNKYEATYDASVMRVRIEEQNFSPTAQRYVTTQRYVSDFGNTSQRYQNFDLFIGNGNSRIFANRFVVDYGYTLNIGAMSRILYAFWEGFEDSYSEDYIKNTARRRVAAITRFNFFIKFGYLF